MQRRTSTSFADEERRAVIDGMSRPWLVAVCVALSGELAVRRELTTPAYAVVARRSPAPGGRSPRSAGTAGSAGGSSRGVPPRHRDVAEGSLVAGALRLRPWAWALLQTAPVAPRSTRPSTGPRVHADTVDAFRDRVTSAAGKSRSSAMTRALVEPDPSPPSPPRLGASHLRSDPLQPSRRARCLDWYAAPPSAATSTMHPINIGSTAIAARLRHGRRARAGLDRGRPRPAPTPLGRRSRHARCSCSAPACTSCRS